MIDDFFADRAGKPLWLVTLADLALLLVGFLVLVQATADRPALARAMRDGFDGPAEAPIALAAVATDFAPGSTAPRDPTALVAWARDALRDPRATVTITGSADGGETLLAADRARAVLLQLTAAGLPADRLGLSTARGPARVTLTLSLSRSPS